MSTLRGTITSKNIGKKQIATFTKHDQPPCWCGRPTYRLNAQLTDVCRGCDFISGQCDCQPLKKEEMVLTG